ncbi:MAG: preprotein translocase subunit SecG [bacterium]
MYTLILMIFVIVCIALTVVILLQSSKGGGLAGAFGGGGGMGAVFGGRGAATFLSRVTSILATAFLLISLILSLLNKQHTAAKGLVEQQQAKASSVPAANLPLPAGSAPQISPVSPQPASGDSVP